MAIPKYQELFNPLLAAMRNLGGSASIAEMTETGRKDSDGGAGFSDSRVF